MTWPHHLAFGISLKCALTSCGDENGEHHILAFHQRFIGVNAVMQKSQPRKFKPRRRYSIGEWYGKGFEKMTTEERLKVADQERGATACSGTVCPFMGAPCNKRGGVCSIRPYLQETQDSPICLVDSPVSVCPSRFKEKGIIYQWVAREILGTTEPLILGEIGFLDRITDADVPEKIDDEDSSDFIGKIDNVLIHPTKNPMDWCALEIQAVYFSGNSMSNEFKDIAESDGSIRFPVKQRRPDWRSSGPKRLLPQLQTKVPTIRTWGKKMAVVIDRPFFDQLVGLDPVKHLSNAEIVWFVVKYKETATGWELEPDKVVYTSLETSVKALTGGTPLSKEAFEAQLNRKLCKTQAHHQFVG